MPNERSTYDEQVVKMTFDNSNFDKNINDSIRALNSLDQNLGLLNKTDFSGITNSMSRLADVFTVKGQIMFGVFARLGSEAVNLAQKGINKLTAGIKDGFGEYNQIIDATQTIFQNVKQSGASLDNVMDALDELNEYADKTIYNFGQMTRMIGMFTSAGVGLNKSVATIKGLANAAALVGANAERAQIAWNAVSRAMSSGTFTNVTWRSLELSNIAGQQFNKVITEVARANKVVGKSGKNIDEMIKKYGSLRLTLSEGWLTNDLFAEAMQIMSKDLDASELKAKGYSDAVIKDLMEIANSAEEAATQVKTFGQLIDTTKEAIGSGWASSFRILIGDLDRAKKMFSRISIVVNDFIDNNARIRNELFKEIVGSSTKENDALFKGLATGKESFEKTIENMMAVVKTFLKSVKTGFLNIFPVERIAAGARRVLDVIQKATRALVLNKEQLGTDGVLGWDTEQILAVTEAIKDLIRFFRGLASAADIAWMAISQPIKVIVDRVPFFKNFFENTNSGIIGLLRNLGKFGDKITVVRNAIKDTKIFGAVLEYFLDNINEIGKKFPVLGFFLNIFKNLKNTVTKIKEGFQSLNVKPLSALFGAFKFIAEGTLKILNAIFEVFKSIKNKIDWSFLDKPKAAIIAFVKRLSDYGRGLASFEDVTKRVGKSIKDAFDKIIDSINKLFSKLRLKTGRGEITKSMSDLQSRATTFGAKIADVWSKIVGFFKPIGDFFKNLANNADWSLEGISKKFALIAGGAGAAALGISHLIKTFGRIQLVNNLNDLLGSGIDVLKAYQKQAESKVILNVALAIGVLAASMAALSFIPYDKLENGLVIFSAFISVLSVTLTPIITAIARFNESLGKIKKTLTGMDVLDNFVKELGKFGKRVAAGINSKLMGQAAKDFAMALFIITGAIAALVLMFKIDGAAASAALESMTGLIIAFTAAVGLLTVAISAVSKIGSKATTAKDTFSAFFTLSGVSAIILSIAAAMAVMAGSLAALSKVDTTALGENFKYFRELLLWTGGIATVLSLIVSGVGALGKNGTRGITGVSLIIVSIAASVAIMTKSLEKLAQSNPKALRKVFDYVKELLVTIGIFSTLITALLAPAQLFGSFGNHSIKILLAMLVSVTAVAGALHLLGKAEPIDSTVIEVLKTLVIALGIVSAVLVAMSAVVTKVNPTFSTSFVSVINKVAISIAAIVASIGIMTAGIGTLFSSLSNINVSNSDANRAANNLVLRLTIISDTIRKALPQIKDTFYNVGKYTGSAFTSFNLGFFESISSTGEAYTKIIDKVINLIIDILGKAVIALNNRKDEIRGIIAGAISLIAGVITEVVNDVFLKDNHFQLKEKDLLKLIGFGGLAIGGSSVLIKLAGNFNTLSNASKNFQMTFGSVTGYFKPFFENLKSLSAEVRYGTASWGNYAKALGQTVGVMAAFVAALALIKIGLESISIGIDQYYGNAPKYIRSDIEQMEAGNEKMVASLKAFFTDADYRAQTFTDAIALIGEFFSNLVMTIVNGAKMIGKAIRFGFLSNIEVLMTGYTKFMSVIDPKNADKYTKQLDDIKEKTLKAATDSENALNAIKNDWTNWGVFQDPGDNVIDGAKKTAEAIETGGEIVASSAYNSGYESATSFGDGFSNGYSTVINTLKGISVPDSVKEYIKNSLRRVGIDVGESSAQAAADVYKNFKVTDTEGNEKTVAISKEYLDIINEEKDALKNLGRAEQIRWIQQKAAAKGIEVDEKALAETYAAILLNQEQQAYVTSDGIQKVQDQLAVALAQTTQNVFGTQAQAADNFIKDYSNSMMTVTEIAEKNKDELVGMKLEEAEEFLAAEAMKSGLTEEEAKEAARNLLAIDQSTEDMSQELSENSLKKKIELYKDEYDAFKAMEDSKLKYEAEMEDLRGKLAATAYGKILKAQQEGTYTGDMGSWILTHLNEVNQYNSILRQMNDVENKYKKEQAAAEKSITDKWKNQGLSDAEIANKWNKNINDYQTAAKEAEKASNRSITTTIKQFLDKIKNGTAGDVDLSAWNFKDDKKNSVLPDSDVKTAINNAADLKEGLEANRADLTPVFDLDKLASDANKANGIVMSSLMAAQNASIGDYINKNSEINPFMKDRWQNVYNFTQNNYSPKALSRIDIYRQTQRQISMSRGF